MPARAYSSIGTRATAVGSGPGSTSAPVPSASGSSAVLTRSVTSENASPSSGPLTFMNSAGRVYRPGLGVTRGASLDGAQSGTTASGMIDTQGTKKSYTVELQNISSPDLSLSFSPSSSGPPPSSSAASPAFFTPPSLCLAAAFRSSPLAHSSNTTAMSASNSPSKNGDYVAVPPSSPGPAELAHPPPAVVGLPSIHSNSGPLLPSISGLPSFSTTSSSATIVAPHTPGLTSLASTSTVPTLSSTGQSPSPPTAFAAPLARTPGGSMKLPYASVMQRVPSEGMEMGMGNGHGHGHTHGHGSARPSADSGHMLRDNSLGYSHPPTFNHNTYPHPTSNSGVIPRPELHSAASRGSMILYRLSATEDGVLPPHPGINHGMNRNSVYSNSGDSIVSLGQDSKYPLVGLGINQSGNGGNTPPRMNTGGSGFSAASTSGMRTPLHPGMPGVPPPTIGSRGGSSMMFSDIGKSHGGLVAYVYDPDEDADADELDEEEEEWIRMVGGRVVGGFYHSKTSSSMTTTKGEKVAVGTPESQSPRPGVTPSPSSLKKQQPLHSQTVAYRPSSMRSRHDIPWRGFMNISTLVILISGLLALFIVFPVTKVYSDNGVEAKILGNTRINATGQAVGDFADVAGNNTTLTGAQGGTAVAAVGQGGGKGNGKANGDGVDKMTVDRREALEQLEGDARRRMERWEGFAKARRGQ
ncbi:hypothetical protein CPB84DRAFT_1850086 [Gymnopilus junonius]|uniref:Uncharacterized protein n=1 Tax=Gymnopilus junonius TaxID=109634 RepID=A0A9P5NF06_GYMJU|nr:hypothetical protein CPB84DRAFT_1850086 [Gymnopilus junonius]